MSEEVGNIEQFLINQARGNQISLKNRILKCRIVQVKPQSWIKI